ncbi:MAG: hypothetical protein IJK93_10470 [Muribaculaceae bacterium]|nr:hypothetical protein [Muribaculaceae bacterium]
MKQFYKTCMTCALMLLFSAAFSSCNLDDSPEYDHPVYVSYTITATDISFTGPEQLLLDIQEWINANQLIYDVKINNSTGEQSDYAQSDTEARNKYGTFASKFKAYLAEVEAKLAAGGYGASAQVKAQFSITATRMQGNDRTLQYEAVDLVYPKANAE